MGHGRLVRIKLDSALRMDWIVLGVNRPWSSISSRQNESAQGAIAG